MELQLAGGGTLRARRAVITVPLGVLKAGDITFEPPLPEAKAAAISSLGFGALDKVQSHCERRQPSRSMFTCRAGACQGSLKIRAIVVAQGWLARSWRIAMRPRM